MQSYNKEYIKFMHKSAVIIRHSNVFMFIKGLVCKKTDISLK